MPRLNNLLRGCVLMALSTTPLCAQEEEQSNEAVMPPAKMGIIMSSNGEGGVLQMQAFDVSGPAVFSIANGMGPMKIGAWMGDSGINANSIDWVQDDNILDELEIVAEQREKLKALQNEVQQQRQDFFRAFQDVAPEKRIEFLRDFSSLLTANVDDKVQEILLPHQRQRYQQLQMQTKLRGTGLNVAHNQELADLLGITDEQREAMRKKQQEVQEDMQKKIETLRKEALDEVLSVLTKTQREKLDKLIGKDYEFKPRSMFPNLSLPPRPATEEKKDQ